MYQNRKNYWTNRTPVIIITLNQTQPNCRFPKPNESENAGLQDFSKRRRTGSYTYNDTYHQFLTSFFHFCRLVIIVGLDVIFGVFNIGTAHYDFHCFKTLPATGKLNVRRAKSRWKQASLRMRSWMQTDEHRIDRRLLTVARQRALGEGRRIEPIASLSGSRTFKNVLLPTIHYQQCRVDVPYIFAANC